MIYDISFYFLIFIYWSDGMDNIHELPTEMLSWRIIPMIILMFIYTGEKHR